MTVEPKSLIYTALLAGSLWISFIVGVNTNDFQGKVQNYQSDHLSSSSVR
jgi:hypothetical protein